MVVQRFNARVSRRLTVERTMLRPLSARRTAEYEEASLRLQIARQAVSGSKPG